MVSISFGKVILLKLVWDNGFKGENWRILVPYPKGILVTCCSEDVSPSSCNTSTYLYNHDESGGGTTVMSHDTIVAQCDEKVLQQPSNIYGAHST